MERINFQNVRKKGYIKIITNVCIVYKYKNIENIIILPTLDNKVAILCVFTSSCYTALYM